MRWQCLISGLAFLVLSAQGRAQGTSPGALQSAPPSARTVVHLWPNGAPGFEQRKDIPEQAASYWVKNINNPSLTVFLPPREKATGAAVVICPGGGFRELVFGAEGVDPAKYFNN